MLNRAHLEYSMLSRSFRWTLCLLLTPLIYIACEIGRTLGIDNQSLAISVFWPATGVSLAVLLLFGLKVWPAIFAGNFLYNFLHLSHGASLLNPLLTAAGVSSGSLIQALVAGFILRRTLSSSYFSTTKDSLLFLLFGGAITCLIASTIGVASLWASEAVLAKSLADVWLTFWLGDTMGVYIFTPLIIVWSTSVSQVSLKEHALEATAMLLGFLLVTFLTFVLSLPLAQLYIPLCLWIAYRFHMHGATLSLFLVTLTTVLFTASGYGAFLRIDYSPLLVLISFLQIIVVTTLIFAAVTHEREIAWRNIRNDNLSLQKSVDRQLQEKKEIQNDLYAALMKPSSKKKTLVHLHTLVNLCLKDTLPETHPIQVIKEFDEDIPPISAVMESLADAITLLFESALQALGPRQTLLQEPTLWIKIEKSPSAIVLTFRDNGKRDLKELAELQEIISRLLQCSVKIEALEGEFEEITLTLPV